MAEVGLSGLFLDYPNSGMAVYTRHLVSLLPAAAPDLSFHLFVRRAEALPDLPSTRLSTPFEGMTSTAAGARLDKLMWETVSLPLASARRGQELLHSLYFAAPPRAAAPLVVTIHDLIPLRLPGYHRSRQAALYSRFMASTARRAAAIITVSRHARKDIVEVLRVPEARVHVTYEGVDPRFSPRTGPGEGERLRQRYGLPERFLLYLGSAERRKNLEMLVRAYSRARAALQRHDVRLVIVADFPPADALYPDVPGLIGELGLDVHLLPGVDEADKPALYRAALAFCFPSYYEGFGFPPLEAMACGTPVLAADATSLPEVVGDGGLLLPPHDEGAWAEAMEHVVAAEGERAALSERGLERARRFCWQRTAQETADVYRQVLSR